ncbi:hypothetical protein I6N90_00380 [Paenibacillus sp. GSMTC-2017]|uniref:carboxypeptidase-like regulatory domain-containing protein n=1 Tax=Paenibacillus sp. GSMTC-2017 TaxID=2794350 RepID=UPI0018D662A3|nr:carboxypeptidase-like regulatory domain-containing protein [Paenibacillus sp. GSMTC-2017]MBH5316263.1 hypothetical protein [Paenibacillus sp. GSMTC-2017]
MMRFRKAFVVMLSMMLLFSFVMVTNASEGIGVGVNKPIKAQEEKPLITKSVHYSNQLSRLDNDDRLTTSVQAVTEQINLNSPATVTLKKDSNIVLKSVQATTSTVTSATYSGTITQTGTSQFLHPIYLQPGQLLQARLTGPASAQLDYDLYLYEFNMSTGALNPTELDYSIYGTYINNYPQGAATLSENVGTRNAITTPKAYALRVYAKTGSSSTLPYYLTVDVTSSYDAYEPDENAFKAYTFAFATGGSTLNSRTIHSSIDNDWYKITVPATRNYDALNIKLDSTSVGYGYKAEVYGVDTGNKLVLLPHTNNNVALGTGIYYVKVSTTNQFSTSHLYSLTIQPVLRAGSISITGYNSSANGPNDYPNYNHAGVHYRVDQNSSFTVKGIVKTTDNLPVANALVSMTWTNPNWVASTGYRTRTGTAYTDQNGNYSITVTLPPSTGSISQSLPIYFTHYFDYTSVLVQVAGTPVTASDNVYHFAYSVYNGGS